MFTDLFASERWVRNPQMARDSGMEPLMLDDMEELMEGLAKDPAAFS
jgi:hypothetical protein